MATDLTTHGYRAVNGEPIVAISESTLAAGASMLEAWRALEPLVRTLTKRVSDALEHEATDLRGSAQLLGTCSTVVQRVGTAAQGMLRTSEGLAKLTVLLSAGRPQRLSPGKLSQQQLVGMVLETAKQLHTQGTACPVCGVGPLAIDVP